MARFTITVRDLIDAGYDFGLEDYPIFREEYRATLNQKILDYYSKYEINGETPDDFRSLLNARMRLIMPKYNWLYFSNSLLDEDESLLDEFMRTLTQSTTNNIKGTVGVTGSNSGNTIVDGENSTEGQDSLTGKVTNTTDGNRLEERNDHGETDNTATTTNDLTNTHNGTTSTVGTENTTQSDIAKNYSVPIQGVGTGGINDTFVKTADKTDADGERTSNTDVTDTATDKNTGTVKSVANGVTDGTGTTTTTDNTTGTQDTINSGTNKVDGTNHSETQNTATHSQDTESTTDATGELTNTQKGFNTPKYKRIAELYNVFHNVDLEIIEDKYLQECFYMYQGSDLNPCYCPYDFTLGWWW